MVQNRRNTQLFRTPFCREYWRLAFLEMKNPRMLVFAAMILALRIALKPVKIPIVADLNENVGFIVNAFGSMVYGPVVALLSGALSDALGFLLFPSGVYFPAFMITEMAGSFVFALFLYRAEISIPRLLLSRFCICFFVNVVLAYPIWVWYYEIALGKSYSIALIRIVKNLALFPIETVILTVLFRHILPPFRHLGYAVSETDGLQFTRRHIALLAGLTLMGACTIGGYFVFDYNTRSFSADYTPAQRLEMNRKMNDIAAAEGTEVPSDEMVTIIESAHTSIGNPNMTYAVTIYRIDMERFSAKHAEAETALAEHRENAKPYTMDTLHGYSRTPASKDDALIPIGHGTIVANRETGEKVSADIQWE